MFAMPKNSWKKIDLAGKHAKLTALFGLDWSGVLLLMIFLVVVVPVRGSWALFGVGLVVLNFGFFLHSVLVLGEEHAPKK